MSLQIQNIFMQNIFQNLTSKEVLNFILRRNYINFIINKLINSGDIKDDAHVTANIINNINSLLYDFINNADYINKDSLCTPGDLLFTGYKNFYINFTMCVTDAVSVSTTAMLDIFNLHLGVDENTDLITDTCHIDIGPPRRCRINSKFYVGYTMYHFCEEFDDDYVKCIDCIYKYKNFHVKYNIINYNNKFIGIGEAIKKIILIQSFIRKFLVQNKFKDFVKKINDKKKEIINIKKRKFYISLATYSLKRKI